MTVQTVRMTMPDLLPLLAALAAYALLANGLAFAAFGLDKRRAQTGDWRVPEKTLLLLAVCGGWIGAKIGQHHYRHKTHKQPFGVLLNLCGILISAAALAFVLPVTQIAASAVSGLQQQISALAAASGFTTPDPTSSSLSPSSDTSITARIGTAASTAANSALATGKSNKPHLPTVKAGKAGKSTPATAPAQGAATPGPQRIGPGSTGKGLSQNFRKAPAPATK